MTATNEFTSEQQELVDLLHNDLAVLMEESEPILAEVGLAINHGHDLQEHTIGQYYSLLKDFKSHCENVGNAADLVGLTGLAHCCRHLASNFSTILNTVKKVDPAQYALVENWSMYVLSYLNLLGDNEQAQYIATDFIEFLGDSHWPNALNNEQAESFLQYFLASTVSLEDQPQPELPTLISQDMVSLEIDKEVRPELLDGLLLELPGQIQEFATSIAGYLQTHDTDLLIVAQRVAHTIKGAANVVDIRGIANLMHYTEAVLESIGKHSVTLTDGLCDCLLEASDCLESMGEYMLGVSNCPDNIVVVMQSLLDWDKQLSTGDHEFLEARADNVDLLPAKDSNNENASDKDSFYKESIESTDLQAGQQDKTSSYLRVRDTLIDQLLQLAGESTINNSHFCSKADMLRTDIAIITENNQRLRSLSDMLEELIEAQSAFNIKDQGVDTAELDPLELETYNELHSFSHQLQELTHDSYEQVAKVRREFEGLRTALLEQTKLNQENQQLLLKTRMVVVNTLSSRFHRCVRQASKVTAKPAQLSIIGDDILMDCHVLNELVAPLLHLLRNAVDHGIEEPEQRCLSGKQSVGQLVLEFKRDGESIIITCKDDGPGLDEEKILSQGLEKSLVNNKDTLSSYQLQQLILRPGFTTSSQVSQTSGRGIGLDVVGTKVQQLNGKLSIESIHGEGASFIISLPVTLLSSQVLIVEAGSEKMAIVSRDIEQIVFLKRADLFLQEEELYFSISEEESIPVYFLDDLTHGWLEKRPLQFEHLPMLVTIAPNGQRCAVIAESMSVSIDVVIKPLNRFTYKPDGVIGATVAGDGTVYPVLDIIALLALVVSDGRIIRERSATYRYEDYNTGISQERPVALVVDDSLSARRSLAEFVEELGMEVRTAKDGIEAIYLLNEQVPALMLVDLEMPRMNGLELTEHVRSRDSTKMVPVIMITSRATKKHRDMAEAAGVSSYLNKPFSDDELLDSILGQLA